MALGLRHTESVTLIYAGQTCLVVAAFLLRFHSDWLLLTGYLAFSVATIGLLSLTGRNGCTRNWWTPPCRGRPSSGTSRA